MPFSSRKKLTVEKSGFYYVSLILQFIRKKRKTDKQGLKWEGGRGGDRRRMEGERRGGGRGGLCCVQLLGVSL